MINVLIVDDELLVRANLRMMIDWGSHGFRICGEAASGTEALEQIAVADVHVVLLDIQMPGMNGYELSSLIAKHYPQAKMIVLSNYDDFEFVKGTLQNGAIDYILKHKLNDSVLLESLAKARSLLDVAPKMKDLRSLNHMITLREKFIQQLLAGFFDKADEIRKQLNLLDISLDSYQLVPVVMEVDRYGKGQLLNEKVLKDMLLLHFSVVNIVEELLQERKNGAVARMSDKRFVILLSFGNMRSQAQISSSIDILLTTIASCLEKFLEFSVSFSIGKLCANFVDLQRSYTEATEGLTDKFYIGRNAVIKTSDASVRSDTIRGLDLSKEREIIHLLHAFKTESLIEVLDALFLQIKGTTMSIAAARMVFYDLLTILLKVCKEKGLDISALSPDGIVPHEKIMTLETADDSRDWFISLFANLIKQYEQQNTPYASRYVRESIKFVRDHYLGNISLTDVAEALNIGSSYLSTLFKEEVGIGFSEYLRNLRIERAKALLEEGKQDMKELVRLSGFNDYDYFLKSFKKVVGITPKEYANGKRDEKQR